MTSRRFRCTAPVASHTVCGTQSGMLLWSVSQRLASIPGIGPITASATATIADPSAFKSGRELAAWIGLKPRQLQRLLTDCWSDGSDAPSAGQDRWAFGMDQGTAGSPPAGLV